MNNFDCEELNIIGVLGKALMSIRNVGSVLRLKEAGLVVMLPRGAPIWDEIVMLTNKGRLYCQASPLERAVMDARQADEQA